MPQPISLSLTSTAVGCWGVPAYTPLTEDAFRTVAGSHDASGGPGRLRSPGDLTMLITSMGHINERACTRWLDHSPGDPEWERMAAPFGESVAEPLTCQTIEELLEAVS